MLTCENAALSVQHFQIFSQIPGFYYDTMKKKYFKIQQDGFNATGGRFTQSSLRKKKEDKKAKKQIKSLKKARPTRCHYRNTIRYQNYREICKCNRPTLQEEDSSKLSFANDPIRLTFDSDHYEIITNFSMIKTDAKNQNLLTFNSVNATIPDQEIKWSLWVFSSCRV